MIQLSWEMRFKTAKNHIWLTIDPRLMHDNINMNNYLPQTLKNNGIQINGFFTPPNIIGLCGKYLENGILKDTVPEEEWTDVISHETLHYILFKYIGNKANEQFDNICSKYNLYNFSQGKWYKNWVKRYKKLIKNKKKKKDETKINMIQGELIGYD